MADNKEFEISTEPEAKPQPRFWDSYLSFGLLVAAILFGRFYIVEPFKIPTGSMEPELIGHEDYGDRIGTNKLAYAPSSEVIKVMIGAAAIILGGFACWYLYTRSTHFWRIIRAAVLTLCIFVLVVGGMGYYWSEGALAGEPKRFDVVVFLYNKKWSASSADRYPSTEKQNYIKRLIGLPGDSIAISGGDLFKKNPSTEEFEIIRKWEASKELQDSLWYPISKAWTVLDAYKDAPPEQKQCIAFPWNGAGENTGARVVDKSLILDGTKDVNLSFKYDASNVYLKQGRWPFRHFDCPKSRDDGKKSESGATFRDPTVPTEEFTAYVTNTSNGVQCPNCKQVRFPMGKPGKTQEKQDDSSNVKIVQDTSSRTNFFYGGDEVAGDLKLKLEIEVEKSGSIQLDVGSNLHSATWKIPGDAGAPDKDGVHPVQAATAALAPGKHTLSLAYVDGTVVSKLDDQDAVYRKISDIKMPGTSNRNTVANISFSGTKGTVNKLELYRDLFYTARVNGGASDRAKVGMKFDPDTGNYYANVPKKGKPIITPNEDQANATRTVTEADQDHFLMLGDNSPGSFDSRGWGFVPKDQVLGRGSFIWWPPSRWGSIK